MRESCENPARILFLFLLNVLILFPGMDTLYASFQSSAARHCFMNCVWENKGPQSPSSETGNKKRTSTSCEDNSDQQAQAAAYRHRLRSCDAFTPVRFPSLAASTSVWSEIQQGSMQGAPRRIKYSEQNSPCPKCTDYTTLSQYTTRLPLQPKSHPSSSLSSTSTSMASMSLPPMTDLDPRAHTQQPKEEDRLTNLPPHMEETLHLQDMELMMHWCTTTYRSMTRDRATEPLWQTIIPQMSLRHAPLRHGVLALSALHLANTSSHPERKKKYLATAREHQSQALAGIPLQNHHETQCNVILALCCLMIVFAFGYCLVDGRNEDDDHPNVLDEFLEVFKLARWVSVTTTAIHRVADGELSSLIQSEETSPTMPDTWRVVIQTLRRQNEIEAARDPAHEHNVYDQAIEHLSSLLEQLMKGGQTRVFFAFCWSLRIPEGFLELLRQRQLFALVVLAHYTVILHLLRDSWWMGDWGTRILKEIGELLDPEWRQFISWVIDATGYHPDG